jgi:hypothetical protein
MTCVKERRKKKNRDEKSHDTVPLRKEAGQLERHITIPATSLPRLICSLSWSTVPNLPTIFANILPFFASNFPLLSDFLPSHPFLDLPFSLPSFPNLP